VLAASNSVALRVAALGNDTQRVLVELGQRNWVWVHCRLGTVKHVAWVFALYACNWFLEWVIYVWNVEERVSQSSK
jgi:hypothetical protein